MPVEPFPLSDPVAACRWWAGRGDPAMVEGLSPKQRQELFDATWERITHAVQADPGSWWAALEAVISSLTPLASDGVAGLLAYVLECQPETETAARELAVASPLALSVLYYAYHEPADSIQVSETRALQRLPRQAAIDAFVRRNVQLETGADTWTIGLFRSITIVDPEWAWGFLRAIIAATSEEELGTVGAGDLEQFCKVASAQFIDRIEEAAHEDPKLRSALRSVWPGGSTIPEPVYRRLRAAAESE